MIALRDVRTRKLLGPDEIVVRAHADILYDITSLYEQRDREREAVAKTEAKLIELEQHEHVYRERAVALGIKLETRK